MSDALKLAQQKLAWADCEDGTCRACAKCCDALAARAEQYERDAREWMEQRDAARADAERFRSSMYALEERVEALRALVKQSDEQRNTFRSQAEYWKAEHDKRRGEVLAAQMVEKAAQDEAEVLRRERDVLKAECASISTEFGLPPTMRPAEGEIARFRSDLTTARARIAELEKDRDKWKVAAGAGEAGT